MLYLQHKNKRCLKIFRNTGTDIHLKRHHTAVVGYNSGRWGFGDVDSDGQDRIVQLSRDKMMSAIGEQLEGVVKSSRAKSIPLVEIESEFKNTLGYSIPMEELGVFHVQGLMELLQSWVRTVETEEGTMVVSQDSPGQSPHASQE